MTVSRWIFALALARLTRLRIPWSAAKPLWGLIPSFSKFTSPSPITCVIPREGIGGFIVHRFQAILGMILTRAAAKPLEGYQSEIMSSMKRILIQAGSDGVTFTQIRKETGVATDRTLATDTVSNYLKNKLSGFVRHNERTGLYYWNQKDFPREVIPIRPSQGKNLWLLPVNSDSVSIAIGSSLPERIRDRKDFFEYVDFVFDQVYIAYVQMLKYMQYGKGENEAFPHEVLDFFTHVEMQEGLQNLTKLAWSYSNQLKMKEVDPVTELARFRPKTGRRIKKLNKPIPDFKGEDSLE